MFPQPRSDHPASRPGGNQVEPLYVKPLPESPDLHGAVLSPDGTTVWAVVHTPVIDVGKLINQHALTCASIVAAVLTTAVLAWLRRAARRRRVLGALHCRRCDYNVSGIAPAPREGALSRCPECGVDLGRRPPLPGRSAARRLWLPLTLLALVMIPYTWYMLPVGHNTFPRPIPEERWGSTTLLRWSSVTWLTWMSKGAAPGELLLEIDAQTGVTRRTVAVRASQTYFPLQYNRFAKAVLLSRGPTRVDLVGVESGGVVAGLDGFNPGMGLEIPVVTGYDATGTKAYLDSADAQGTSSWITEWDWRSGATRRIGVAPAWTGGQRLIARHHTLIPGQPPRFLRYTDFSEAYDTKHFRLMLLDAAGAVEKEKDLGDAVDSMAKPSFSPDGKLLFLTSGFGRGLRIFDPRTLELVGEAPVGLGGGGDAYSPVSPDGRYILVPFYQGIAVCDISQGMRARTLMYPNQVYAANSLHFSDDGRTVCAVFQSGGQSGVPGGFVFQLGVWKLPELPAPPVEPAATPSTPTKPQP